METKTVEVDGILMLWEETGEAQKAPLDRIEDGKHFPEDHPEEVAKTITSILTL